MGQHHVYVFPKLLPGPPDRALILLAQEEVTACRVNGLKCLGIVGRILLNSVSGTLDARHVPALTGNANRKPEPYAQAFSLNTMPIFSRKTILAAIDTLEEIRHSGIDRYVLEHGLEDVIPGEFANKQKRVTSLARYLLQVPEQLDEDGRNLTDVIVKERVAAAIKCCTSSYAGFDYERFQRHYRSLHRGLTRDGFTVRGGQLQRALPKELDLPQAQDEVHALLDTYTLATARGHLDQAITAHGQGDWAAANGQLRSFVEEVYNRLVEQLDSGVLERPPVGYGRQRWLAQTQPPFFSKELNEWTGKGTGFLEAFYRRLHPQGPHAGLSDEDDSTFRLHLVLLVARLLLRRLRQHVST